MEIFEDERIWRLLTNFWTTLLILFLVFNFISKDAYDSLIVPFSIIYTGTLSLYVGTKEFDRWYELHESRHPGEIVIIIWTTLIVLLYVGALILGAPYKIPSETVIADYIMVLSVYAITQKSKKLHRRKKK
jgi:hypothetical protein